MVKKWRKKSLTFVKKLYSFPTKLKIKEQRRIILDSTKGTIPILRQQKDWVGGVRKMAYFADGQKLLFHSVLEQILTKAKDFHSMKAYTP